MRFKTLFVQPAISAFGPESLSAYLKSKGQQTAGYFDPCLFDDQMVDFPFMRKLLKNPAPLYRSIEKHQPDLIAIPIVYNFYPWALQTAKAIKERYDIPIVVGGIHPTSCPEHVLQNSCFDYTVIGEGEEALYDLTLALAGQMHPEDIPNLCFLDGNHVRINPVRPLIPDLDTLPFPDKELLPSSIRKYQAHRKYSTVVSRGCANNCSYCCHSLLKETYKGKGRYLRFHSVDYVIRQLSEAKEKYNLEQVVLNDDNLVANKKWFRHFALEYKKHIDLPYFCWVSPSSIDEERAQLLEESGCKTLEIGVQTTKDAHLTNITNRKRQTSDAPDALRLLAKTRIFIVTDNIVGLPESKVDDIRDLIRFYLEHPVDQLAVYWLKYFPRTRILEIANEKGILSDQDKLHIEQGRKTTHYRRPDTFFSKEYQRYCELLLLSNVLPKSWTRWLAAKKHRLWLVPTTGFYRASMVYLSLKKNLLEGKCRVHNYYNPPLFAAYYLTQTFRAVIEKMRSLIGQNVRKIVPAFLKKAYQNLSL